MTTALTDLITQLQIVELITHQTVRPIVQVHVPEILTTVLQQHHTVRLSVRLHQEPVIQQVLRQEHIMKAILHQEVHIRTIL